MILFRRSLWFFVGLLIAASINFAYAADYPALHGFRLTTFGGTNPLYFESVGAACAAAADPPYSSSTSYDYHSSSYPPISCFMHIPPGPATYNFSGLIGFGYWCPGGGSLSGTTCTGATACASGEERNSLGVCVALVCTVGQIRSGYIPKTQNPGVVCFGGCEAVVESASNQAAVDGVQVIAGKWSQTGVNTCSGSPDATSGSVPPSPCPANTCPGEVSGAFTCLPCSDAAPDEWWKKTKEEKVNADGSTTKTETTEKGSCNGENCTTEKTTTKTDTPSGGGGGTTENTSEKKEQSQEDFCAANPNSDKCKREGAGTGASITGLYEAESATFQGTYDSFKSDVASAPLIAATTGFFNVSAGAGTCPTWTWDTGEWGTYTIDIFCEPTLIGIFEVIGNIVLLGAVLAAIFIALF